MAAKPAAIRQTLAITPANRGVGRFSGSVNIRMERSTNAPAVAVLTRMTPRTPRPLNHWRQPSQTTFRRRIRIDGSIFRGAYDSGAPSAGPGGGSELAI